MKTEFMVVDVSLCGLEGLLIALFRSEKAIDIWRMQPGERLTHSLNVLSHLSHLFSSVNMPGLQVVFLSGASEMNWLCASDFLRTTSASSFGNGVCSGLTFNQWQVFTQR